MSEKDRTRLPISNEAPARKGRSVRDKVIQRFQQLAPVAVIAAVPVLNTACDPAPEPYCSEGDPKTWVANMTAAAEWIDGGGGVLKIQVTLGLNDQAAYLPPDGYTAKGGTIDSTTGVDSGGYVLVITPDAGVTEVTVSGVLGCDGYPGPFAVTLSWSGTPAAGDKLTTTVTAVSK